MKRNFMSFMLISLVLVFSFAGITNYTSLKLKGDAAYPSDNLLEVETTAGVDVLTIAYDGTMTHAGTRSLWFSAEDLKLPAANPAAAGEEDSIGTLVYVDAAADDHAWLTFIPPSDMDTSLTMEMSIYYILPSGTPTEGAWNIKAIGLDDDEAGAAATAPLEIILDTPSAAGDWNMTSSATVPTTVTAKDIMNFIIYHDVADPFGGTVELAGVKVTYTTDEL